jgi:hypothetical protein
VQRGQFSTAQAAQRPRSVGQPFPKRFSQTPAFGGELDPFDPPVLRVGLTANGSHCLQAIDHAGQVRSVVLELPRQRTHRYRSVSRQLQQHLGLHCREPVLGGELSEMRFKAGMHLKPETNDLSLEPQVILLARARLFTFGHGHGREAYRVVVLYRYSTLSGDEAGAIPGRGDNEPLGSAVGTTYLHQGGKAWLGTWGLATSTTFA